MSLNCCPLAALSHEKERQYLQYYAETVSDFSSILLIWSMSRRRPHELYPVFIPDLSKVRRFAADLHAMGRSWEGEAFGWPAEYQPEIKQDLVEIEEYDEEGNRRLGQGPFWSPAAFMIGESGVWFYSLSWERGRENEPVAFIDDRNLVTFSGEALHESGIEYHTGAD